MTRQDRDRSAVAAAKALEKRLMIAIESDYPGLRGWLMRRDAIRRIGPLEDDWRWDCSLRGRATQARRFLREAIQVAAARVSERHGLGAGSEWAARHFGCDGDERRAEAQVLASLASVRQWR